MIDVHNSYVISLTLGFAIICLIGSVMEWWSDGVLEYWREDHSDVLK